MNPLYRIAVFALCALAVLQIAWYGWWSPPQVMSRTAAISFALIWFALPLLAARQDVERGLLVGSLIALLFFTHGIMEAWANPAVRILALIEVTLSALVIGCAGWPSWQRGMAKRRLQARQDAE